MKEGAKKICCSKLGGKKRAVHELTAKVSGTYQQSKKRKINITERMKGL